MKVSIITVSLNSEKHIAQTIQSVLNQSYGDIEYIIIDGGSTDGTLDIVRKFEPLFYGRLKWISEKDKGIYDGMNKGIRMATGELIGFINSDDWYDDRSVEITVHECSNNKDYDIFYGNTIVVSGEEKELIQSNSNINLNNLLRNSSQFCHQSSFTRKYLFDTLGTFDLGFPISADYEFWVRCSHHKCKFYYINCPISFFRVGGISSNSFFKILKENTHVRFKYNYGYCRSIIRFIDILIKTGIMKIVNFLKYALKLKK